MQKDIIVRGAREHNLKNIDLKIPRNKITVVTGVSGSGKSSLVFDTILSEAQRRFFYTLSNYSRQYLEMSAKPDILSVSGLSPAIAVSQNETAPSKLATVGTLSDISELLGVMFARFSTKYCPKHNLKTESMTTQMIAKNIFNASKNKVAMFVIPFVIEKKGHFATQLQKFYKAGFLKAFVDGKLCHLGEDLDLDKSKKHTIQIIVDAFIIKDSTSKRLMDAIKTTLEHGQGSGELTTVNAKREPDSSLMRFSLSSGCPKCGYSWPKLDSRYFAANSLGRCETCSGLGFFAEEDEEDSSTEETFLEVEACDDCSATGIRQDREAIMIAGHTIHQIQNMELTELQAFCKKQLVPLAKPNPAFKVLVEQIMTRLEQICGIGLGYTILSRRVKTLSTGEFQRLRLANVFGQNLRGVLYVLDEPSQGLHPSEVEAVWEFIVGLRDKGNTVLIIDHDALMMQKADLIVDMGPGGGAEGGQLMGIFPPKQASSFKSISTTANFLNNKKSNKKTASRKDFAEQASNSNGEIIIHKPSRNNLTLDKAAFKIGALNVVTGVSGAGKSSLVIDTLYPNLKQVSGKKTRAKKASLKKMKVKPIYCQKVEGNQDVEFVHLLTRKPIAKSSISMPATYLDVMKGLREIFAKLPEAQISGLTSKAFSIYSVGGRCETCKGRGAVLLSMRFLPDARVVCETCEGQRFTEPVLAVQYNGHSINQILNLTILEVFELFKNHSAIRKKLQPAIDLGLGYLKFGQPTSSLSGGESQRLKLSPFLTKTHGSETVIVIEEPTTGLHFQDVQNLLFVLKKIVSQGTTVILIEHNDQVIMAADRVLDIGPGAASDGGELVYQGAVSDFVKSKKSKTASYL